MDVVRTGQIVAVMLLPTALFAVAIQIPRIVRAVQRLGERADSGLEPSRPPIEQLADNLRRLLLAHEALMRSTDLAMRALRLRAIEGAITDVAMDAAQALDLPCPPRTARDPLLRAELSRLLRALADAGLVLPPAISLLEADKRL